MKILVSILNPLEKKKAVSAKENSSLRFLQKQLKLNGQTFVSRINGKIAHPETILNEGDKVEFIGVIYGG